MTRSANEARSGWTEVLFAYADPKSMLSTEKLKSNKSAKIAFQIHQEQVKRSTTRFEVIGERHLKGASDQKVI